MITLLPVKEGKLLMAFSGVSRGMLVKQKRVNKPFMMTCLKGKGANGCQREILVQEKQDVYKKRASSKNSCKK